MSKHKRKKSNRKPVSRERIAQASYAKRKGLLSKQAKLNNNMISRGVAKKLQAMEEISLLPTFQLREGQKRATILDTPKRTAVKIKPALAKQMREQGFEVIRGHAVIPKGDKRYTKALSSGQPAGIRRFGHTPRHDPRPIDTTEGAVIPRVEVDTVEVIALDSLGIRNYADLHRALENSQVQREAKRDDEVYAFTIFGFHSRLTQFFDDTELLDYLERYKWTQEKFDNFELIRMRMGDDIGPTPDWVYEQYRGGKKRSHKGKKKRGIDKVMAQARENRAMQELRQSNANQMKQQKWRDNLKTDTAKHNAHKVKDAARAKAYRAKLKASK